MSTGQGLDAAEVAEVAAGMQLIADELGVPLATAMGMTWEELEPTMHRLRAKLALAHFDSAKRTLTLKRCADLLEPHRGMTFGQAVEAGLISDDEVDWAMSPTDEEVRASMAGAD